MKTKDFIRRVEELGFDAEERGDEVYLYGQDSKGLAKISKKFKYTINTFYLSLIDLNEGDKGLLFDLIVEYISTPVDEREEEKKFYLKHRWVTDSVWFLYLYRDEDGRMGVSRFTEDIENQELGRIQVKFTLKEIEEIKKKFNTDLADFELVEVED